MRHLKVFVLGLAATAIFGYAAAAAAAVIAQSAGRSLSLAVGPLVVVSVESDAAGAVTTFGPGLAVVAIVGGLANLCVAQFVGRRSGRRGDSVE